MKRKRLQLSITMFLKKVSAVQFAVPVPQASTSQASSEAEADISSTSSIDDD